MSSGESLPVQVRKMLEGPYWRVIVRPLDYRADRIPYEQLPQTLVRTHVQLRGWDFPHLSNRNEEVIRGSDYFGAWNTFFNYEYWRLYESGQFIHYHGVREYVDKDYRSKLEYLSMINIKRSDLDWSSVKGYIEIINFLYTVSEIFEFASRLAKQLQLDETVYIEIALHNISGFILTVGEHGRAWFELYQWQEPDLSNKWTFDVKDLEIDSARHSLDAVAWFFRRFGWMNVNLQALKDTQATFLRK